LKDYILFGSNFAVVVEGLAVFGAVAKLALDLLEAYHEGCFKLL